MSGSTLNLCANDMQSMYLAAQRKSQSLSESVEGLAVEGQKLTERLVSAEAQYLDGMRKTKATSRQLQSLSKEVHASEQAAHRASSHTSNLCMGGFWDKVHHVIEHDHRLQSTLSCDCCLCMLTLRWLKPGQ